MSAEPSVVRHVLHADAGDWLLAWSASGWLPASAPAVAGRTAQGQVVLRVELAPVGTPAAEPVVPEVPVWLPGAR